MKLNLLSIATIVTFASAAPAPFTPWRRDQPFLVSSDTGTDSVSLAPTGASTEVVLEVAGAVASIALIVVAVVGGIKDDIKRRQQFTKEMVSRVRQKWPMHSIVVANTKYAFSGSIVHKVGAKYKSAVGRDVTYDVLMWDHGTFQLQGDGGFQNWAYILNNGCSANGGRLSCR